MHIAHSLVWACSWYHLKYETCLIFQSPARRDECRQIMIDPVWGGFMHQTAMPWGFLTGFHSDCNLYSAHPWLNCAIKRPKCIMVSEQYNLDAGFRIPTCCDMHPLSMCLEWHWYLVECPSAGKCCCMPASLSKHEGRAATTKHF